MLKNLTNRFYQYALLMRWHKPIGICLLLWPTLWALWIAGNGRPPLRIVIIFIAGVVLMRSAGCVINDYADQRFDGHVQRTRQRPLVTGKVSRGEALGLFVALCAGAALLPLGLNRETVELAVVAVLLAVIYPFMKRITHLPQIFLGVAFAWGIPMAFAAQAQPLSATMWLLFAAATLWIVAYDTFYAMADREEDQRIGVKSTAILFGHQDRVITGLLQGSALLLLAFVGMHLALGKIYYISLLLATLLVIHQLYLIRNRDAELCFKAFLRNNELGAVIFLGIFFSYGCH